MPVLLAFVAATAIQMVYWIGIFSRLARYTPAPSKSGLSEKPVSIVICARNEAENLQKNLDHIINQNYRSLEIVVVNDNSGDTSEKILLDYAQKHPNFRIINIYNKSDFGKKYALTKGIEAASNELVLLTDADCCPASPHWVSHMQSVVQEGIDIGLGYAPYASESGFLNRFIRYETLWAATQYLSFALAGMPYMGVGRNLIYRKQIFKESGGFKRHQQVISGDDDLFINQIAKPGNTAIAIHPESFVYSTGKNTWKSYYRQKTRHLSTGRYYDPKHQWMLGLLSISHFLHYALLAMLVIFGFSTIFVILLYAVRILLITSLSGRIYRKLNDPSLLKWVPILDAVYVFYYIVFTPALIFKSRQWK